MTLWTGAALGVAAAVVAIARPSSRRWALLLAALLFLPIGVFGILSIGAVFLLASALCLMVALFSKPDTRTTSNGMSDG